MTATLTIIITRNQDAVEFDCEHATTRLAAESPTGEAQRILVGVVMARHAVSCACQPAELVEVWPSMAEAIAIHEEDARDGGSVAVHMLRTTFLDTMRSRCCPDCDPEVVITTVRGLVEQRVNHDGKCPTGVRRGRARRVRVLDFAEASA